MWIDENGNTISVCHEYGKFYVKQNVKQFGIGES